MTNKFKFLKHIEGVILLQFSVLSIRMKYELKNVSNNIKAVTNTKSDFVRLNLSIFATFYCINVHIFVKHTWCGRVWTFAVSNLRVVLSCSILKTSWGIWADESFALLASAPCPITKTTTIPDEPLFYSDQTINTWPVSMLLSTHAWLQFSIKHP